MSVECIVEAEIVRTPLLQVGARELTVQMFSERLDLELGEAGAVDNAAGRESHR